MIVHNPIEPQVPVSTSWSFTSTQDFKAFASPAPQAIDEECLSERDGDEDLVMFSTPPSVVVAPHMQHFFSGEASRTNLPSTPPSTPRCDQQSVACSSPTTKLGSPQVRSHIYERLQQVQPASIPAPPAPVPSMSAADLDNPRTRYTLHKELRHSIFGKVYMGTDETNGSKVAIKVSIKKLLESKTSLNGVTVLEDPLHEAEIMKRTNGHPNVVTLVGVHEDNDLHWMVQEYISGGELFDYLTSAEKGFFSESEAKHIFSQALAGMQHIHSQGIAHLDLSLENMLVDHDGTIKICDFGLARPFQRGQKLPLKGNKPGKLGYMAPEIFQGRSFHGDKADVFSAGVVLFTLLTGHPPFEYASREDRRYDMIANGELAVMIRMLRMTDRMSLSACDLLSSMLHPSPSKRPTLEQIASHPWFASAEPKVGSNNAMF